MDSVGGNNKQITKKVINEEHEFGRVMDDSPEGSWQRWVNNKETYENFKE